jgi:hypothetical protein
LIVINIICAGSIYRRFLTQRGLVFRVQVRLLEPSVFSDINNRNVLLRLLTAIAVSLFLFQSAFASIGLADRHSGSASPELCATLGPSSADNGEPSVPDRTVSHHGFCCIVHTFAITFPPKISNAYLARLQFPHDLFELWASEDIAPARLGPSTSPQSPRAPPHSI